MSRPSSHLMSCHPPSCTRRWWQLTRIQSYGELSQVLDRIAVAEQVDAMPESLQAMLVGDIGFSTWW